MLCIAVLLLPVGGGVAYFVQRIVCPPLPDPAVADRDQLVRWLVLRDLSQESPETRRVLVERLEAEFRGAPNWSQVADRLNESQREVLWNNLVLLLEPWFLEKADRYSQLAVADRPPYVDQFLDRVAQWRRADAIRYGPGQDGAQRAGLAQSLLDQVEQWKQRADPTQRARIDEFLRDVELRWIMRKFLNLAPLFKP